LKIGRISSLKWKQTSTNSCFGLHIYLRTNKTLIHDLLYVFESWGKRLSHRKMQYSYGKEMFRGRAKQIWIIGCPDNQRPDQWSYTVLPGQDKYWNTQFAQTRDTLVGLYIISPHIDILSTPKQV